MKNRIFISLTICATLAAGMLAGCGSATADKPAENTEATAPVSDVVSFQDGFMDLSADWYFNAYRKYNAKADELDKISAITPEVYQTWGIVQPGLDWWTEDFDDSLNGNPYFGGYAWYVRTFTVEGEIPEGTLQLSVGSFDESNEVYVNGELVGSTGVIFDENGVGTYDGSNPWEEVCVYEVDSSLIKADEANTIAIRMCNSSGGGGWYQGPIGFYATEKYDELAAASEGRFITNTYISPATGDAEQTYRVYLPEGYEEGNDSYPVLYMLHGINSSGKSFAIDKIDELLDEAIAAGEIDPMIVVLPDDPTKESFWMEPYDAMVAEDLVAEVDKNYRTLADKKHRYIGGCSMGGGGAFHIGTVYPDSFGGIISFYGALNMCEAENSVDLLTDEQLKDIAIWMACGDQDMYKFFNDQRQMDDTLTYRGIDHYSEIAPGEHNSEFYLPRFIQAIKYVQDECK